MLFVKVIDWQTREQFQLPRVGQDNYVRRLIAQGYDLVLTQPLGRAEIEIDQADSGLYAVYHPAFGTLDSECLFVNIPSEDEVQMLVSNSQQRLEPIQEMFGL
jgi:hypothetical protein